MTTEKEKQIEGLMKAIAGDVPVPLGGFVYMMAEKIYNAGYRLPAPLSPISDTEIRDAMKKDFARLYVSEYTTDFQTQRLARNIEINIMGIKYLKELLAADRKSSGQG